MAEKIIICGIRSCEQALQDDNVTIKQLWCIENTRSTKLERLQKYANLRQIDCHSVSRRTLDTLTGYMRHQGIALECLYTNITSTDATDWSQWLRQSNTSSLLLLVLDHIQDTRNLGACLRCADATAVDAVIIPRRQSARPDNQTAKTASGALNTVPVFEVANLIRCLQELKKSGLWLVATSDHAEKTLYETELSLPMALILGNENKGIQKGILSLCDTHIRLPMLGKVASLNLAVACGICLYDIRHRQHSHY